MNAASAVPPGEFGATTLLTNLSNRVQPIIRYDLGDRVRFVPGACACGSSLPVIDVQGRADDVLTLEDAQGHAVHLAPLALTTVLEDEAGVFDFQLAQRGPHALRLDVFGGAPSKGAADALRGFLREQGLGSTRVQCHSESSPPSADAAANSAVWSANTPPRSMTRLLREPNAPQRAHGTPQREAAQRPGRRRGLRRRLAARVRRAPTTRRPTPRSPMQRPSRAAAARPGATHSRHAPGARAAASRWPRAAAVAPPARALSRHPIGRERSRVGAQLRQRFVQQRRALGDEALPPRRSRRRRPASKTSAPTPSTAAP